MSDLQKKDAADLMKLLDEKREDLRVMRFDLAGTSKKDVKKTANTKKEIARILTEVSARKKI